MDSGVIEAVLCGANHFFEGAEKCLEIWFYKTKNSSLRQIPLEELHEMLKIAECRILHLESNKEMDSYVLSESSMFISDQRLILKTCGTTEPLKVIDRILWLAEKYSKMTIVNRFYYSRKNFLQPKLQPQIHHRFEDEIKYLDKYFPGFLIHWFYKCFRWRSLLFGIIEE